MSNTITWEDFERDYPTAAKKFLNAYTFLTPDELEAVKKGLLVALETFKVELEYDVNKNAPRDGTCPGCQSIICYLFAEDRIWEHANPTVVYSPDGHLTDKDGKKYYVSYPICSGSGKQAECAYTPLEYDPSWHLKPHHEVRMILGPEQAQAMRMRKYD